MEETKCYCSVVVSIEHINQCQELEQLLKDFLENTKHPSNILEFDHVDSLTTGSSEPFENAVGALQRNSQSFAICLFLKEDTNNEFTLKRHFERLPWQLDHVIVSSLTKRPQKIFRQEFYSCSNDLPLMSVSSVHYGNEHIRFHMNVKNFNAMKKFYEGITDRKAKHCGPNFCFLTIFSDDGLDVQIALKKNPAVFPLRNTSFRLKFRIQSVSPLFKYLASSRYSTNEATYELQDPDGNDVIVERSYTKISGSHNQQFQSTVEVDKNNNFEGILEESLNSSGKKYVWSKYDFSEHGLFPQEAISIHDADGFTNNQNEAEIQNVANNGYKDYITFV